MPKLAIPVSENMKICTMCGKEFEKDVILVKDGDLCPECRKQYGNMAYIFCNKCNAVVTRIQPGLAMGLLIKPGDMLHVNECPQCTPGVVKSIPVEVEEHAKGKRLL